MITTLRKWITSALAATPAAKGLRGHLLALGAGCLITLSLEPFNLWFFSFLAPLSLGLLLRQLSAKQAALRGWLFGLGVFGSGASWVFVSIHDHSATPTPVALLLTCAFIASLAVFFALHAWIWCRFLNPAHCTDKAWNQLTALVSWPALWVLMEVLRSWAFTGFPWLLLGTAHLDSFYSGWVPLLGVYGLSALSVLTGQLIFLACTAWQKKWQQLTTISALLLLIGTGLALNKHDWTQPDGASLSLGLVQGNIAQADKWQRNKFREIINTYLQLSHALGPVDIIIWPETALPLLADAAQPYMQRALTKANSQASLISGLVDKAAPNSYYNGIYTAGASTDFYHKVKLVPFGEYLPLENYLRGLTDFFNLPMSSFVPGHKHPALLEVAGTKIAPLICYEVAYPDFSARQAQDSNWLLTISNDAWFGASLGPLQHLQLARFRALETGRPMARVTNNGITALIDHKGTVQAQLPQFTRGSLQVNLQPRSGTTPFMLSGSQPLIVLSLVILLGHLGLRQIRLARSSPSIS